MRDIGAGTIRRIDWQELTPVVLLLRIFNTATGLRVLSFSLIGLLLTLAAGSVFNMLGRAESGRGQTPIPTVEFSTDGSPVHTVQYDRNLNRCNYLDPLVKDSVERPVSYREETDKYVWQRLERSILLPWNFFSQAGGRFFSLETTSWRQRGLALGWFASVLLIWTFFGGLICRTVAMRLTVDESESPPELWRFMKSRGTGFVSSVIILVLGVLLCLIPIKICGLLFTIPGLNYVMAVLFPIALFSGFFAILLLIGLWLGWPLLFSGVAVDGADGFDAISRMFSYVFQRPLHYLFYWTVGAVIGAFGFIVLSFFVYGVIYLTVRIGEFPVSAEVPKFEILRQTAPTTDISTPQTLVAAWCTLVNMILPAYAFTWFWTTAVSIYILLRRSVDATPFGDIFRPVRPNQQTLPEIKLDEKGAPEIVTND